MPKVFQALAKKYGGIMTIYFGALRSVVLSDSKLIHEALVENSKFTSDRLEPFIMGSTHMSLGMVFASGDHWRQGRRFILRAMRDFGMGKEIMVSKVHEELAHFLDEIENLKGSVFDLEKPVALAITNIICLHVFGKRFEKDDAQFNHFNKIIEVARTASPVETTFFFILPFLRYIKTPAAVKLMMQSQDFCSTILMPVLKEHRQNYDGANIRDFPDLYIQQERNNEPMDLDQFKCLIMELFFAGSETTTMAIMWTIFYMTKYPDIQRKCQEEIDAVIDTDRLPSTGDRSKLVYIDAVMNEVHRIVGIAPLSLFHANLDKDVTVGGHFNLFFSLFLLFMCVFLF